MNSNALNKHHLSPVPFLLGLKSGLEFLTKKFVMCYPKVAQAQNILKFQAQIPPVVKNNFLQEMWNL